MIFFFSDFLGLKQVTTKVYVIKMLNHKTKLIKNIFSIMVPKNLIFLVVMRISSIIIENNDDNNSLSKILFSILSILSLLKKIYVVIAVYIAAEIVKKIVLLMLSLSYLCWEIYYIIDR